MICDRYNVFSSMPVGFCIVIRIVLSFVNLQMQGKLWKIHVGQRALSFWASNKLLSDKFNFWIIKFVDDSRDHKELPSFLAYLGHPPKNILVLVHDIVFKLRLSSWFDLL